MTIYYVLVTFVVRNHYTNLFPTDSKGDSINGTLCKNKVVSQFGIKILEVVSTNGIFHYN